jgi:hypothetical protein
LRTVADSERHCSCRIQPPTARGSGVGNGAFSAPPLPLRSDHATADGALPSCPSGGSRLQFEQSDARVLERRDLPRCRGALPICHTKSLTDRHVYYYRDRDARDSRTIRSERRRVSRRARQRLRPAPRRQAIPAAAKSMAASTASGPLPPQSKNRSGSQRSKPSQGGSATRTATAMSPVPSTAVSAASCRDMGRG